MLSLWDNQDKVPQTKSYFFLQLGPELELPGYGCEDHFQELETVEHCWECISGEKRPVQSQKRPDQSHNLRRRISKQPLGLRQEQLHAVNSHAASAKVLQPMCMQPDLLQMCTHDSNDGGRVDFAQDTNDHDTYAVLIANSLIANSLIALLESMMRVLPAAFLNCCATKAMRSVKHTCQQCLCVCQDQYAFAICWHDVHLQFAR